MSVSPDIFNAFLLGHRLFQQWIVDGYVKVEKDRIEYVPNNQKQWQVKSYQGLVDHLSNNANNKNCQIGKMIILPSTFVGSPAYDAKLLRCYGYSAQSRKTRFVHNDDMQSQVT